MKNSNDYILLLDHNLPERNDRTPSEDEPLSAYEFEMPDLSSQISPSPSVLTIGAESFLDAKTEYSDKLVAFAENVPVALIEPTFESSSSDASIWGLAAIGADSPAFDGSGVRAAILDTGVDITHPAFLGVEFETADFTNTGLEDVKGHGTHCAGTFFGRAVEGRRIGVAPGIRNVYSAKVLDNKGRGTSANVFAALHEAIYSFQANVVSLSLGFNYAKSVELLVEKGLPLDIATGRALSLMMENSRLLDKFVQLANQATGTVCNGATIIAASGNSSKRNENSSFISPSSIPASTNGIVACGALGRKENTFHVSPFSNSDVSVSAPGEDIVSASSGGGLSSKSGTSMACPHAAGVAAMIWEKARKERVNAKAIPTYVISELEVTCDSTKIANHQFEESGHGIVVCPT